MVCDIFHIVEGRVIPRVPPGLSDAFTALYVEASYDLTAEEFVPFRPFLGQDSQRHIWAQRTTERDGHQFSLAAVVGIHDYGADLEFQQAKAADAALTGFDLHYGFRLRRGTGRADKTDAGWDEVIAAVRRMHGTHSVDVVLYQRHETSTVVPAVALPIAVKETDVPGFSEIRGVRLVKAAPEAGTEELYSVTIDRAGDQYHARIATSIELPLDEEMLVAAHERARSIADLAFHKVSG